MLRQRGLAPLRDLPLGVISPDGRKQGAASKRHLTDPWAAESPAGIADPVSDPLSMFDASGAATTAAMSDARTREASLITFLAAAADITLLGIGGGVRGIGARAGGACRAQRSDAAAGTYIGHDAYACKREGEVMTEALNARNDGCASRAEFAESPMQTTTSDLMRACARQPVSFVRGSGARLWDAQGVEYLDEEQLGERLCALTGMEGVFFCNSGAQANEPPSSWPGSPPRTTRRYDEEEDEAGRIIARCRPVWHRKDLSDEWHRLRFTEDGAGQSLPRWIALLSKRTENFTGAVIWDVWPERPPW